MRKPQTALFTDFYQLTMMQGYLRSGVSDRMACFDMFIRSCPFESGFAVFAGLEDALTFLEGLEFHEDDIDYLHSLNTFDDAFLDYLRAFRFSGTVHAFPEGSVIFPGEPVVRVIAPLHEAQVIESGLLNQVNFQTLIATKAARVCYQAGVDNVIEFGLRRAQGPDGGLSASRAAYIGGCSATSNVEAGRTCGIPVNGTHAHSWVMAFDDELTAFRQYATWYPDKCVLLVDTYDTLASGLPNAITVGKELKEQGHTLLGIRIDSGDLAYLSQEARKMLDEAGLTDTKIVASSELDESVIHHLKNEGAKIDMFGVGTNMVTAKGESALTGVYKLAAIRDEHGEWQYRAKISDNVRKATLPGLKQVYRLTGQDGYMTADIVEYEKNPPDCEKGIWGHHPFLESQKKLYEGQKECTPMLVEFMKEGRITRSLPEISEVRAFSQREQERLHPTMRRLLHPHIYKVSLGENLYRDTRRLRHGNIEE